MGPKYFYQRGITKLTVLDSADGNMQRSCGIIHMYHEKKTLKANVSQENQVLKTILNCFALEHS